MVRFAEAMEAAGIGSYHAALAAVEGVRDGSYSTPRQFTKALGIPDYKSQPATQAFQAAQDLFSPGEPAEREGDEPEQFKFRREL